MKSPSLFREYTWLIYTIYRAGRITLEDIQEKWIDDMIRDGQPLSRSTFNRHKISIEEMFGISICCSRTSGYQYYLEDPESLKADTINNWLLSTIAINALISQSLSLNSRILLENIPSGHIYLQIIIAAMKDGHCINLKYKKFGSGETRAYDNVQPYCLKVFHQRWYMLGKVQVKENMESDLYVFALDRFVSAEESGNEFEMDSDFDAATFFDECFGVFAGDGLKAERILLRAYGREAYYINSLPLHHSQQTIASCDDYTDFELYLRPSFDFIQDIRSRGSNIEILSPAHLRQQITDDLKATLERYRGKRG